MRVNPAVLQSGGTKEGGVDEIYSLYRKKWLLFLVIGLIFVSFMQTGLLEEMAARRPDVPGRWCQQLIRPSETPSPEYKFPDEAENLVLPRLLETGTGKQPGQGRYQLYRYLAVVTDLYLLPDAVFRAVVRRFGVHVIKLWQEVDYIHCADGEKENASVIWNEEYIAYDRRHLKCRKTEQETELKYC